MGGARSRGAQYGTIEVRPVVDHSETAHRRARRVPTATSVRAASRSSAASSAISTSPRTRCRTPSSSAAERWPRDGTPANPGAWIVATARNRGDRPDPARADARAQDGAARARGGAPRRRGGDVIPDERLELIFACCHPALAAEAQVALTLSLVGGLTTPEIARAFLVPEPTLAQRLVRAKRKIRDAGIPLRVPPEHLLPERLRTRARAIYLVFNAGYGPPVRRELCARGDPARAAARDADAGRGGGARPARAAPPPGRAARRARLARPASSSCSTTRTARSGTRDEIEQGRARARAGARAAHARRRTSCRPRSPRCTPTRTTRLAADRAALRPAARASPARPSSS